MPLCPPWRRHLAAACSLLFTCALFFVPSASAEEPAASPKPAPQGATDNEVRMKGVLEAPLPETEKKSSLRLILHPHVGDFTKRDHLRTAVGLRYGITKSWEISSEADAYFTHGLKKGSFFDRSGFSTVHLGTKYLIGDPFKLGWETSVGLEWQHPLGTPPIDVTDGLQHWKPFITFARPIESVQGLRFFFGGGWDDVSRTSTPGQLDKNELGEDTLFTNAGILYQRGQLTYTLEGIWETSRFFSKSNEDIFTLRPGIVWVVPPKYTLGAKKGRWLFGVALRLTDGPDGFDVGFGAKLRINFDFKRLLGRR